VTRDALLAQAAALAAVADALRAQAEDADVMVNGVRCYSFRKVAELLDCDEDYARDLGRSGRLPVVKFGDRCVRVQETDLAEFIRLHKRPGGGKLRAVS
jgi:excisionase family DNA binding protein